MRTQDGFDRRSFFKTAGAGIAAGVMLSGHGSAAAQALTEKGRLDRLATNLFKEVMPALSSPVPVI